MPLLDRSRRLTLASGKRRCYENKTYLGDRNYLNAWRNICQFIK